MKKYALLSLCVITASIFGADKKRFRKSANSIDKKAILRTIGTRRDNDQVIMNALLSQAISWKEKHGIRVGQAPINLLREDIALACARALVFELELKRPGFGVDHKVLSDLTRQKGYIENGKFFKVTNLTLLEMLYNPQTDTIKQKLDLLHTKVTGELENLRKRIVNPHDEDDVETLKEMEKNHCKIICLHEKFNANLAK